ncbi:redoxin domain-containing protein [bacterium]|nr:MAG: redoxin domain-containing protein [bacterium]
MIAFLLALQVAKLDAPVSLAAPLISLSAVKDLAEAKGEKSLVVFFFNEQCGVTYFYKARMQKLMKDFEPKGFAFAGVRTGRKQYPDRPVEVAEAKYLTMPFFDDAEGALMDRFGVGQSLTFAVIDQGGTLRYFGGFDDNVNEKSVKKSYLRDALRDLANGRPVAVKRGVAMGCAILPVKP